MDLRFAKTMNAVIKRRHSATSCYGALQVRRAPFAWSDSGSRRTVSPCHAALNDDGSLLSVLYALGHDCLEPSYPIIEAVLETVVYVTSTAPLPASE
jgi:hypothetical protein